MISAFMFWSIVYVLRWRPNATIKHSARPPKARITRNITTPKVFDRAKVGKLFFELAQPCFVGVGRLIFGRVGD